MSHPGIGLMRALARLPLPWLRALGGVLGRLLFVLARRRRHVALTNLRLAFPDWSEAERVDVARRSFIAFAQSFIDRAWVWHAPDAVVRQRIRLTGAVDELRRPEAAVLFAPHFYGMDAGGAAIMQQAVAKGGSIYSPQSGAATDAWVRAGRERFGDVVLINRRDGVKPVVKSLREGRYLYLLPDMDLGPEESVFVPFFGVPAATLLAPSRMAKLLNMTVQPVLAEMLPGGQGYRVRFLPPWSDFPSDDALADTARMNRWIEERIRENPAQYLWVHKRFKTRPAGEASLY